MIADFFLYQFSLRTVYTCILCMGSNLTPTKESKDATFIDRVILTRNLLNERILVTHLLGMKILILLVEIFQLTSFVISSTTVGEPFPRHINGKGKVKCTDTVFPQIDSAGTIDFMRSKVRVLIKGGHYLRAGTIQLCLKLWRKLTQKQLNFT